MSDDSPTCEECGCEMIGGGGLPAYYPRQLCDEYCARGYPGPDARSAHALERIADELAAIRQAVKRPPVMLTWENVPYASKEYADSIQGFVQVVAGRDDLPFRVMFVPPQFRAVSSHPDTEAPEDD